jgi:inosine-uridine nucleoside N-ribohydrolase
MPRPLWIDCDAGVDDAQGERADCCLAMSPTAGKLELIWELTIGLC